MNNLLECDFVSQKSEKELILRVMASPNSNKNDLGDIYYDENNVAYIRIYTTATPEKGEANKVITKIISKKFKIPKKNIELIKGSKNKIKVFIIKQS